eukprot:5259074-Pleurochrysis_carterae.AAC.1
MSANTRTRSSTHMNERACTNEHERARAHMHAPHAHERQTYALHCIGCVFSRESASFQRQCMRGIRLAGRIATFAARTPTTVPCSYQTRSTIASACIKLLPRPRRRACLQVFSLMRAAGMTPGRKEYKLAMRACAGSSQMWAFYEEMVAMRVRPDANMCALANRRLGEGRTRGHWAHAPESCVRVAPVLVAF